MGAVIGKILFIGSLSTSARESFSLEICLRTTKFVLLSFFALITTICPKIWTKTLPKNVKSPLPVYEHRSKTPLLPELKHVNRK